MTESGLIAALGTGGPIIAVLAFLSVASLALIVAKTVQLWPARGGAGDRDEAMEKWSAGDPKAAVSALAYGESPADQLAHFAMTSTMKKVPRRVIEAELERRGNQQVETMSRHIRLLELVAMISPLLGLLGTVLGMITSFQELELAQGAANASVLAGGIWQALLTTAAGLVVAIPAAVGATLLTARVDGAAHDMESAVGRFFVTLDTAGG